MNILRQLQQNRLILVLGVGLSLTGLAILLIIIFTSSRANSAQETEQADADVFSFRLFDPEDYDLTDVSTEEETHSVQMTGCTPVEIAQLPFTEASPVEVAYIESRADFLMPELEKFTDLPVVAGGDGQCVLPSSLGQK